MARVGVDEWVARSAERTEAYGGRTGALRRAFERVPAAARLALAVGAGLLFGLLAPSDFALRVGVNTLLLVILAVGLNVAVGWAGLLDLGYIAFYGFGAYGYALLSSDQLGDGIHLPTWQSVPIVVIAAGLLGLLLGLPSRRLLGDYLAIVTLFFGQVFLELVINLDRVTLPGSDSPVSITGGPNGIPGVDAMTVFGHEIVTTQGYYFLLLVVATLVVVALHLLDTSRTGRAWRAVREDPLAASFMTIPVNAVKLLAFMFGAAIAALAGTIFAAVQIGVFPQNFDTPFLIIVYAALILGGAGSLSGAVLGGVVIGVLQEVLRTPADASVLFYGVIAVALVAKVRPWAALAAVVGGTVALGLAANAIVGAISPSAVAGHTSAGGALGSFLGQWLILPADPRTFGNWCFVAAVAGTLALTTVRGAKRYALMVPVLYLGALAWENRLVDEPSITRQILLGALLVVLMTLRPQGLVGERRVEVL
jgi:ABC-type branched-subunit amino acid transport system permease subunit